MARQVGSRRQVHPSIEEHADIGAAQVVRRELSKPRLLPSLNRRVVEIGCGTGRNFALLERAVGPGGAVIAVDVSEAMLARARHRADRNGWSNVELVRSDAATCGFPAAVDGVLSTHALVVIPEYDRVIERACQALKEGKRCVVLDQKLPSGPVSRLVPLLDLLACGSPSGGMQATFESRSCILGSSTWQWARRTLRHRSRSLAAPLWTESLGQSATARCLQARRPISL